MKHFHYRPQETTPNTRLARLESGGVALSSHMNKDFLNHFYFCKENKEVCSKNLGRMECSLRALPLSAMRGLLA